MRRADRLLGQHLVAGGVVRAATRLPQLPAGPHRRAHRARGRVRLRAPLHPRRLRAGDGRRV